MRCSVIIPCHNGEELTRACIASLRQQAGDEPEEILLVDNASTDGTRDLAALHPSVRVLRQPHNLGFAGGVNAGVRAARGAFVLVLNNDTQAAPNLLRELRACLLTSEQLGAVSPRSNHVKGHALLPVGRRGETAAGRDELMHALRDHGRLQDVATLAGLCLLLRRATFDRVGLFDERFGHGNFEDDDLCLRLRLHGYRLAIAGRAFLHHEGHATFKHLGLDLRSELDRRRAQFTAKWRHDPAGAAHLAALAGDLDAAATAARTARPAYPQWPDADWHLAQWHHHHGRHDLAAVHLRALLRHEPHQVDAKLLLLRSQFARGDAAGADATFASIADDAASPAQHTLALRARADHHYHAGRPDAALHDFRQALELSPGDGALHNGVGLCLLAREDLPAAATAFTNAAASGAPIAFNNLGICHARQGHWREARECFTRAHELLPDDPAVRANVRACGLAYASTAP